MTDKDLQYAKQQDEQDELKDFRDLFHIPIHEGKEAIYFCGNSLGLQPKSVEEYIQTELKNWREKAIDKFFEGENPWLSYHRLFNHEAELVGAKPSEVVLMNALTVNLHLMMVSFYRPEDKRFKIMMEAGAFPSDQYAVESQLKFHGYSYEEGLIELKPRKGEHTLRTADIIHAIETHEDEIALVLLPGIQYYTGQWFDIEAITKAAHGAGAKMGWDCAHATGNVPMKLHEWNVDFAVWCTYKYMNSGPGAISGAFVHERHHKNEELHRFAGWWGYKESARFKMEKNYVPEPGAAGWQMSTAQIIPLAAHRASLAIFEKAGFDKMRKKAVALTNFLESLIKDNPEFEIITPKDSDARGCQLSILTGHNGRDIFNKLAKAGIVVDWREPNVIRLAPVPLYNTFEEVYRFAEIMNA